jgi:hypothetical protein
MSRVSASGPRSDDCQEDIPASDVLEKRVERTRQYR